MRILFGAAVPIPAVLVTLSALVAAVRPVEARKLLVGPGKAYPKPMAAAAHAADGDTVDIDPGTYSGEAAVWRADNLVLRGIAKHARLVAPAVIPGGKAIWVIQGRNTLVENIEFRGAAVPDRNGAGIRQEGDGLTVRNCVFRDNENGILGGGGAASEVVVEFSEFASNGHGDGYSHNLYIAAIASFTFRFCNTHHAKVGHDVKSRARRNLILYNRIWDGQDGTASLEIDLPNGGTSYVIGNIVQQGPATENSALLSYGAEGLTHPGKDLYVVNNTLVNDRSAGGTFVSVRAGAAAKVWNNIFAGPGTLVAGAADTSGNWSGADPGFLDRSASDYRLADHSPSIDRGKDPGSAGGVSLRPSFQYRPEMSSMARPVQGPLDAGAYEAGTDYPAALWRPRPEAAREAFGRSGPGRRDALGRILAHGLARTVPLYR